MEHCGRASRITPGRPTTSFSSGLMAKLTGLNRHQLLNENFEHFSPGQGFGLKQTSEEKKRLLSFLVSSRGQIAPLPLSPENSFGSIKNWVSQPLTARYKIGRAS